MQSAHALAKDDLLSDPEKLWKASREHVKIWENAKRLQGFEYLPPF